MNFLFDTTKATEVACQLIHREGGSMNIMKLVKLVYLLDRISLEKRSIPVVGGDYFSLRNGPITSEFLDLINSGQLEGEKDVIWCEWISDRDNHMVELKKAGVNPPRDNLSDSELKLIELVYTQHGSKDQWALRDWCHAYCPEWSPLKDGRRTISLEDISAALGKTPLQTTEIKIDAYEHNFLTKQFSP